MDQTFVKRPLPSADMLKVLGERVLNEPALSQSETTYDYARRVWKIEDTSKHSAF